MYVRTKSYCWLNFSLWKRQHLILSRHIDCVIGHYFHQECCRDLFVSGVFRWFNLLCVTRNVIWEHTWYCWKLWKKWIKTSLQKNMWSFLWGTIAQLVNLTGGETVTESVLTTNLVNRMNRIISTWPSSSFKLSWWFVVLLNF